MKQSRALFPVNKYSTWAIPAIAILYLAIAWFWKYGFIWGKNDRIYWLLIVFDWTVFPLAVGTLLCFIDPALVLLVRLVRRQSGLKPWARTSGVRFVAGLCSVSRASPLSFLLRFIFGVPPSTAAFTISRILPLWWYQLCALRM